MVGFIFLLTGLKQQLEKIHNYSLKQHYTHSASDSDIGFIFFSLQDYKCRKIGPELYTHLS